MSGFQDYKLSKSLEVNIKIIQEIFNNDGTLILRRFENQYDKDMIFSVFYINGMVDNANIDENILVPLMNKKINMNGALPMDYLMNHSIYSNSVKKTRDVSELSLAIIDGDTVLFLESCDDALIISTKGFQTRPITESTNQKVLSGPREAFTESLAINLTLLRRRIRSNDLKFELSNIGTMTRTQVCLSYVEGLVDPILLKEIKGRLSDIEIDKILGIKAIGELIDDKPYSIFEVSGTTERPDVAASKLLEGRIALFVDGDPSAMTLPYIFIEYFQTPEDYYINYYFATISRLIRILAFILATSFPAIYLALITYHQEILPTSLLLSIFAARQGTPFPSVIELLGLLFVFEILREAGERIPVSIGQALSIVGALVLGTAAVDAKIISAPIIIIVGFAGITSLIVPALAGSTIILRIIFVLLASLMGLYGYLAGLIGLLIHLFHLSSFNVPFMSTTTSLQKVDLKDTFFRGPLWFMERVKYGGKK